MSWLLLLLEVPLAVGPLPEFFARFQDLTKSTGWYYIGSLTTCVSVEALDGDGLEGRTVHPKVCS